MGYRCGHIPVGRSVSVYWFPSLPHTPAVRPGYVTFDDADVSHFHPSLGFLAVSAYSTRSPATYTYWFRLRNVVQNGNNNDTNGVNKNPYCSNWADFFAPDSAHKVQRNGNHWPSVDKAADSSPSFSRGENCETYLLKSKLSAQFRRWHHLIAELRSTLSAGSTHFGRSEWHMVKYLHIMVTYLLVQWAISKIGFNVAGQTNLTSDLLDLGLH